MTQLCCLLVALSLIFVNVTVGLRLLKNYDAEQSSSSSNIAVQNCESEHPVFNTQRAWTTREAFDCYKTWHEAKLAALRQNKDCSSRPPLFVMNVNRGLGDSGMNLESKFNLAFNEGRMLMLVFSDTENASNVWKMAMDAPFDWDLRANRDTLCFTEQDIDAIEEGPIGEAQAPNSGAFHFTDEGGSDDLWFLLMPPKAKVLQLVDSIMSQVKRDEMLVGVHFRSQWANSHHACGCKDSVELPKCTGNIGSFLAKQGFKGWNTSKIRTFVASDQENGIFAFERAFGKQNLLKIPDEYPIEHSLECSEKGAIRAYADLIILSKADALLGSCGSTFSSSADRISHRSSNLLLSGSTEAEQCASMTETKLDLSGFSMDNFVPQNEQTLCNCYAPGDERGGACSHACTYEQKPSKCDSWLKKNSLAQISEFQKISRSAKDKSVPWRPIKGFK